MTDSNFDGSWVLACQTIRGTGFLGTSLDIPTSIQVDFEIEGRKESFPAIGVIPDGLSVQDQTKGYYKYDAEMYSVTLLEDTLLAGCVRRRPAPGGQAEDDDTDVFIATRKPTVPPDGD